MSEITDKIKYIAWQLIQPGLFYLAVLSVMGLLLLIIMGLFTYLHVVPAIICMVMIFGMFAGAMELWGSALFEKWY